MDLTSEALGKDVDKLPRLLCSDALQPISCQSDALTTAPPWHNSA